MPPIKSEKGNISRFTKEEKKILISLFREYEEIIDIKQRKNSTTPKKNFEVRQCWQRIVDTYNDDPNVVMRRNLKQLQKFWLNFRLRKRYPSIKSNDESLEATTTSESVAEIKNPSPSTPSKPKLIREVIGKLTPIAKTMPTSTDQQKFKYDFQIITHDDESSSHVQHVSIDTISTDNLSLNDLLEFKSSPQTEIIELKPIHSRTSSTTIEKDYDEETVIYQHDTDYDGKRSEFIETVAIEASSNDHHQQPKKQQIHVNCCCNRRNQCASIVATAAASSIDDRLNTIRIKEAELKYKHEQLRYEQQRMELTRTRESLQHMRKLQRLQIQEMRAKLKILAGEEKKIAKE